MNTFYEMLGFQSINNWVEIIKLILRFSINMLFVFIVIKGVYAKLYKNRIYEFTYFIFNIVTFFLCILMRQVPAELGFALAIFAVFGVLRYRTEQIRMRDVTYLFIVIGIALVNAIAYKNVSFTELIFVNICISFFTFIYERKTGSTNDHSTHIIYDTIALVRPEKKDEFYQDLEHRIGGKIIRVEILKIDYLRDVANLQVYYSTSN